MVIGSHMGEFMAIIESYRAMVVHSSHHAA
jgi:hypothetical protein